VVGGGGIYALPPAWNRVKSAAFDILLVFSLN